MRRFAYRLAFHLGYANVDAMLRSMTAVQLQEWMVFYSLEPFGEDRQDARFGSVTQVLMNIHRNSKKHPRPFKLSDAVLSGGDAWAHEAAPRKSWQEMKALAMAMTQDSQRKSRGTEHR